jgi:hypothetical protein
VWCGEWGGGNAGGPYLIAPGEGGRVWAKIAKTAKTKAFGLVLA